MIGLRSDWQVVEALQFLRNVNVVALLCLDTQDQKAAFGVA